MLSSNIYFYAIDSAIQLTAVVAFFYYAVGFGMDELKTQKEKEHARGQK